jgi:hypothetical protein
MPGRDNSPAIRGAPPVGVVPEASWAKTLADFSHRHRGWLLQAWALPTAAADDAGAGDADPAREPDAHEAGRRELAAGVPLHGVELDSGGTGPAILVHACDEHGSERGVPVLRIDDPRVLVLERSAVGDVAGLRVDDAYGHTTRLHFRTTAPPETLNGLAETEL